MAPTSENICLVDGPPLLARAFREMGCTVCEVTAAPRMLVDLPGELESREFRPDLVLQVERLGPRSLLTGLDGLDCPLLFWCVDPHLNAHWHALYARSFDMVCSTQRAWIPRLRSRGARDVRWLPWFGRDIPFAPWDGRVHGLSFVGRLSPQRPARTWMVEFLARRAAGHDPALVQEIPFDKMMALYARSRIVANEAISGEVNFRLFEGASAGCLVLGQDIPEQDELFEPGREMDTYAHVLELGEKLDRYLQNPRLTRTMAMAAHARVQGEHLPAHRAAKILEYARDCARNRACGAEAAKWTALAVAALWEGGQFRMEGRDVLGLLAGTGADNDQDIMTATLRVQACLGLDHPLAENLRLLLTGAIAGDNVDLSLAASMASLAVDMFSAAKTFWYRHLKAQGRPEAVPGDPDALRVLWARELQRLGRVNRPGAGFQPGEHLPGSAVECLLDVLDERPEDIPVLRLLESMLRTIPGSVQSHVGFLSLLTLHERGDWRLALESGLANLKSYRPDSGLDDLRQGLRLAREQGQEPSFLRVLKGRDPSGLLARALFPTGRG